MKPILSGNTISNAIVLIIFIVITSKHSLLFLNRVKLVANSTKNIKEALQLKNDKRVDFLKRHMNRTDNLPRSGLLSTVNEDSKCGCCHDDNIKT
jgi:hypothetical protein